MRGHLQGLLAAEGSNSRPLLVVRMHDLGFPIDAVAWLDAHERQRVSEFRAPVACRLFLAGAILLRLLGGALEGCPPEAVRVVRSCPDCDRPHGKPVLPDTDLSVSLSHSGSSLLAAVHRGGAIGVDLEVEVPADHAKLLDIVLGGRQALDGPGFLREWVRREAVLKAWGTGLRVPMDTIRFSPASDGEFHASGPPECPSLWVTDLDLSGQGAAALAAPERPTRIAVLEGWRALISPVVT